jgi:hypothetical protein
LQLQILSLYRYIAAAAADASFDTEDRHWSEVTAEVDVFVSTSSDQLDGVFEDFDLWSTASLAVVQSAMAKAAAATEALRETQVGAVQVESSCDLSRLESAWFQTLSLSSENLVSKFAFTFNLYRFTPSPPRTR